MSATDELRRLLDERGVEYVGTHPAFTAWWGKYDLYWSAMEVYDGELDLGTNMSNVTPEQAIAATLGRGECHISEYEDTGIPVCSECGAVQPDDYTVYYCWACGRRVVGE